MLIGEFRHSIDSKGRIIIPSKFREELKDQFVMTKGLDNCLFVYPIEEWEKITNKIKELPMTSGPVRSFVRTFFSGAIDQSLDKQGRVIIPQNLREHAQIDKEAVIIGLSTRIEVWSLEKWQDYQDKKALSYEEMAEQLAELGI
ncbi:division/cell wall cluster transcriptional repressor MraZ [Peptoniphilus catoniae]|uniref:division/cell wall cluster transcriptional repressor MraZ n=1 Tax=Peptoniphilus catoniae TaxID=1660341 RepID=UPI0010FD0592|nr:division/cell wall cluster transcriptional repressor MraZ [Peptoniphilus catoniae]